MGENTSVYVSIDGGIIEVNDGIDFVSCNGVGAVNSFCGVVRKDFSTLKGLQYDCYNSMACKQLYRIAYKYLHEPNVELKLSKIYIRHRVGFVANGELSLFVAVSSPHRGACFTQLPKLISDIKSFVPLWKKEIYISSDEPGGSVWISNIESMKKNF